MCWRSKSSPRRRMAVRRRSRAPCSSRSSPSSSPRWIRGNRVPSQARFIAVGQNDETGAQLEYSGFGNLDEKGTRTVDFLFRGPDRLDRSTYGLRDVLRASTTRTRTSASRSATSSMRSLPSPSSWRTRGAPKRFFIRERPRSDRTTRKPVGTHPRSGKSRRSRATGSARAFKLRANFLNKRQDASPTRAGSSDDIYTIQARINPGSLLNLGLEYAHSSPVTGDESSSFAHRITLDGRALNRVWYTFENTYAAPDFPGYYRDVSTATARSPPNCAATSEATRRTGSPKTTSTSSAT